MNFAIEESAEDTLIIAMNIDLAASTRILIRYSQEKFRLFNHAFANHLWDYARHYFGDFQNVDIKFLGDGWLIFARYNNLTANTMVAMAINMMPRFSQEIASMVGVDASDVPAMRIAICAGHDTFVQFPNGQTDWLGDSARFATRSAQYSEQGKIVIDSTVQKAVLRVLECQIIGAEDQKRLAKKYEHHLDVYWTSVENLRSDAALGTFAEYRPNGHMQTGHSEDIGLLFDNLSYPERNSGTLDDRRLEKVLIDQIVATRQTSEIKMLLDASVVFQVAMDTRFLNRLIFAERDFERITHIIALLGQRGVLPDCDTHYIRMVRAPYKEFALNIFEPLLQSNLILNHRPFMFLLADAATLAEAQLVLAAMEKAIGADAPAINCMLLKYDDLDAALSAAEAHFHDTVRPDVWTANTLLNIAVSYSDIGRVMDYMARNKIGWSTETANILIRKYRLNRPAVDAIVDKMGRLGLAKSQRTINEILASAKSYEDARGLFKKYVHELGHTPDIVSFNIVLRFAPDDRAGRNWLRKAQQYHCVPDAFTLNTQLGLVRGYRNSIKVVSWFKKAYDVVPDQITIDILQDKLAFDRTKDPTIPKMH